MEYVIREAVPADEARIDTLFREMLRDIYGKPIDEHWRPGAYFDGKEDRVYTAEATGEVIAFLSAEVHREERPYLYIDDFCVTAACRGQGIGNALLDRAEGYAAALGIPAVLLHVERENEGARRLYERRGYRLLEEQGSRLLLVREE